MTTFLVGHDSREPFESNIAYCGTEIDEAIEVALANENSNIEIWQGTEQVGYVNLIRRTDAN